LAGIALLPFLATIKRILQIIMNSSSAYQNVLIAMAGQGFNAGLWIRIDLIRIQHFAQSGSGYGSGFNFKIASLQLSILQNCFNKISLF
jgi:hypothetical protein